MVEHDRRLVRRADELFAALLVARRRHLSAEFVRQQRRYERQRFIREFFNLADACRFRQMVEFEFDFVPRLDVVAVLLIDEQRCLKLVVRRDT